MANVTTTNPIFCDTAGTLIAEGTPYVINRVSFQASADDEDVLLSDSSGNKIWQGKVGDVSVDGYNIDVELNYSSNRGLVCTTIDGTSELLIYV